MELVCFLALALRRGLCSARRLLGGLPGTPGRAPCAGPRSGGRLAGGRTCPPRRFLRGRSRPPGRLPGRGLGPTRCLLRRRFRSACGLLRGRPGPAGGFPGGRLLATRGLLTTRGLLAGRGLARRGGLLTATGALACRGLLAGARLLPAPGLLPRGTRLHDLGTNGGGPSDGPARTRNRTRFLGTRSDHLRCRLGCVSDQISRSIYKALICHAVPRFLVDNPTLLLCSR